MHIQSHTLMAKELVRDLLDQVARSRLARQAATTATHRDRQSATGRFRTILAALTAPSARAEA
jgi:hypothetical protein